MQVDSLEGKMKKSIIVLTVAMMVLSVSLFGDDSFDETMNEITVEYIKIKDTLVNDKTEKVNDIAKAIMSLAKKLDSSKVMGEHKEHFTDIPTKISVAAKELSKAKDIKAMRKAFKDLSKPMAMWATMVKPNGINVAYCPMAPGSWLQTGKEIRNPYYGASMLKCGDIVSVGAEDLKKHVCTSECKHDEMKEGNEHNSEMMKDHKCDSNCKHS